MWSLESVKNRETKFYFLVGEDQVVGRKDCQILITGDQSISRKHATLTVKHPESNLNRQSAPSVLTVKETSKYGTRLNGNNLASNTETQLQKGDRLIFGTFNTNDWRVENCPVVVAASALPPADKRSLKTTIHKLGGHMVSDWCLECTHLVMSQLNVTVKVISALAACRPIVTPDFWTHTTEAIREKSSLPEPETYLPPITEPSINKDEVSFSPNERRKTVFSGKTFYFLTQKQYKRLHIPISMAGGRSELLEEDSRLGTLGPQLTSSGACVLYTEHQDGAQAMSQTGQEIVTGVLSLLKKHGLRTIPESELGLAVLYVSTELHCNSEVAQAGLDLLGAVPYQSLPTQNVLATDTQTSSQQIHGRGGRLSRKAVSAGTAETASTSHQPKQNLTSTPKISKIEESIVGVSLAAHPSTSARPTDASPELHGKTRRKVETSPEIKAEIKGDHDKETLIGTAEVSTSSKGQRAERGGGAIGETAQDGKEENLVQVKEERPSPVSTGKAASTRRRAATDVCSGQDVSSSIAPEQPAEILQVQAESNARSNKETAPKVKQRQGTLDMFRRVKKEKDDGGGAGRVVEEEDTVQVKEEPMEQSETGEDQVEGATRRKDSRSKERGDDRGGSEAGQRPDVQKAIENGKSGKRKATWTADDDDDDDDEVESRGQPSRRSRPRTDEAEGSNMWKKKARIDVFSQEEEESSNSQSREEQGDGSRALAECGLNLPRGFISARVPIEDQVSVKVEQDYLKEEGLPSRLIQIKDTALIVRKERTPPRHSVPEVGNRRPVKNFKKFRKAGYAGQTGLPRIIGGGDLFAHQNNPSKDIEEMFDEEVRAEKKRDKQEEMADKLFAFDSRRAPSTKRKR